MKTTLPTLEATPHGGRARLGTRRWIVVGVQILQIASTLAAFYCWATMGFTVWPLMVSLAAAAFAKLGLSIVAPNAMTEADATALMETAHFVAGGTDHRLPPKPKQAKLAG